MKKIILSMIVVSALFVISVNAQDFKPVKGTNSIEMNFTPLSGSPLSIDYFKYRMFLSDKQAFRLGIDLNMVSSKETIDNGTGKPESTEKNSYFIFGLHPGIEMHLAGTERLSPYYGAEIGFTMKSSKGSIDNLGGNASDKRETKKVWTDGSNDAYTSIGLNLITGFDYYVFKNLYLGAEIGLGFASVSYPEQTVTTTIGSTSTEAKTPKASASALGFNYNGAIRLGWSF